MDQLVFEELMRERFPKLGLSILNICYFCHSLLWFFSLNEAVWVVFYSTYASGAVNHLDYLGVQVAWISGPWFLSIFVNMLPWESGKVYVVCVNKIDFSTFWWSYMLIFLWVTTFPTVFRVWDVLLFEGNRVMLFRTALALMELYGTRMCVWFV